MKGMARLRVSRDAKQSVWRSLSGRFLMVLQRSSRGNSGKRFDGAIVVDSERGKLCGCAPIVTEMGINFIEVRYFKLQI